MPPQGQNLIYVSGQWQVDIGRRQLLSSGVGVPIGSRAFEIIEILVRSANELVTKNDLMDRIWPGATVGENTLQVHISAIRKAFGPDRSLLKTASGRGYRLLGDWIVRRQEAAKPPVSLQRMRVDGEFPVTNFPAIVTRLVGRTAAVTRLRDLVSAYRVVTLAGPGGIGKTSLALKVARGIVGDFARGGWLVELASLSDPTLVPSAVAGVLQLKLGAGQTSGEAVARAVGDDNFLLLLDNCEHVIDAVASFTETVLRFCPHVTIMATSREILHVAGECVYRVAPLEVPAMDEAEPDQILSRSAVALFVTRATALDSDFAPRAENLPEIAAICRQLDGIPLAIEFAAARASALGVQQVTAGLRDRFELLTAGRRTALPRHRTLRATLDWSYELLPDPEKRLLRRLAIFSGGFTLAATAVTMDDLGRDSSAVTDGIANLVAKSLVALDRSETETTETRWYLLETTRAYALEKLADSDESGLMARRHAEYFLALFGPFAIEGQLQTAIDDLGNYHREVDNLRAALSWAFSGDGDASMGVALAAAAGDFWLAVSLIAESCEWAEKALARIGDAGGTRREMVVQCNRGITLIYTKGMVNDAREALMRALTLAREFTDFYYQQRATLNLWLFSVRASALDDALVMARQFEDVSRLGDVKSRATADWLIGMPQIYLARHIEACEHLLRAIDQYPIESRSRDMIQFAGHDLRVSAYAQVGVSLLSRGLVDAASRSAVTAVEEARGTNQPVGLCVALAWAAGFIFLNLDELELAERYGEELIDHAHKYALRPFYAAGLYVRGSLAVRRGDLNHGVDLLRRGLAEMQQANYLLFNPFFLVGLAAALGALGRADGGLAEIDAALLFATDTGHRWFVPETLRVKGQLLALRGSDDPAYIVDLYRESMRQASEQHALYWELSTAISFAELLRGQHREEEARGVLAPVYGRFTEGFSTAKLQRAKVLLSQLS